MSIKNWNKHRQKVKIRHIKHKEYKIKQHNKKVRRTLLKNPNFNDDKKNKFKEKVLELKFPAVVNFDKNFEDTTFAFEKLVNIMKTEKAKIKCFFNVEDVTDIEADVIIYMLALIRNLRVSKIKKISFSGNLPSNKKARSKMVNTGFLEYVYVKDKKKIYESCLESAQRIEIKNERKTSPEQSSRVVTQLATILNKEYTRFYDLYETLIELQNNTIEHARNKSKRFENNEWYLYTEESDNYIEYVFLDTGPGIPDTVSKKKFFEETAITRPLIGGDSKLIESALNGEFRSQTGEKTRGNGLPRIKESVMKGILEDMTIYSGKGKCFISKENKFIKSKNHKNKFEGTLFKWKIMKEIDNNEKNSI